MKNIEVGTRVCAKGQGTDAFAHYHATVTRMTKTLIIVAHTVNGRAIEDRFNREFLHSVPRSDWGGVRLSTTCQKKEDRR